MRVNILFVSPCGMVTGVAEHTKHIFSVCVCAVGGSGILAFP